MKNKLYMVYYIERTFHRGSEYCSLERKIVNNIDDINFDNVYCIIDEDDNMVINNAKKWKGLVNKNDLL